VFDAIGYPKDYMETAYSSGMNAIAFTDHGNMNAVGYVMEHSKKMNAEGRQMKPIFGIEAYTIPSIDEWNVLKEKVGDKKKKKQELAVEDEEETKRARKNALNHRAHLVLLAQSKRAQQPL